GVGPGSSVYIAGAGPVGTAAAVGAQLLGASVVIMADMNAERLENAAKFGCETIDVSKEDPREGIARILGREEVDAGVDAVGFEARGHGKDAGEAPATVLNTLMDVTRDRKSTRLNSSHVKISYCVFCLKKKNKINSIHDKW